VAAETSKTEKRAYRSFALSLCLALLVCFLGIFVGLALRTNALLGQTMLERARSLFREIVITREWVSEYGGVYVFKKPGMASNPFLINPDLKAEDGRILTLHNPATMTREISRIAEREKSFQMNITSLKPLNPANLADPFERAALLGFERGGRETWAKVKEGSTTRFRYMSALVADESCLQCHAVQGYKVGDIRGGISISFDVGDILRTQRMDFLLTLGLGSGLSLALIWIILSFFHRLRKKLEAAHASLLEAAVKDGLTGLYNRRHVMERFDEAFARATRLDEEMACAVIDVDDFKKVNDELGHLAGDAVLRAMAGILAEGIRPYDLLGRYGGEEFLLILPGAGVDAALPVCERMRRAVEARVPALTGQASRPISISVGIAARTRDDRGVDDLIGRADAALYRAKAAGKNRCAL
jgi:diguanylate cyclase (GGDEF)-like protein